MGVKRLGEKTSLGGFDSVLTDQTRWLEGSLGLKTMCRNPEACLTTHFPKFCMHLLEILPKTALGWVLLCPLRSPRIGGMVWESSFADPHTTVHLLPND
jgi:hypothetical protein